MIHIEYYRAPERFALSVKGHAGFAPAGRDIVCAAVSVLVSELSLALEQAAESGEIRVLQNQVQSGKAFFDVCYREGDFTHRLIGLIMDCLAYIRVQYAAHVTLEKCKKVPQE